MTPHAFLRAAPTDCVTHGQHAGLWKLVGSCTCVLKCCRTQVTMRDPVHHYFGGGAAALNMHERMADMLLMVLSLSMESPGAATPVPVLYHVNDTLVLHVAGT